MSEETQMPSQSFFGLPKELVRRAILYIKGDTGARGPQGPQGEKGDKGDAATVAAGTTTTLPAGSSARVTNSGTSSAAVFNFAIPQGATGPQGPKGDKGDKGDTGATGPTGPQGPKGDPQTPYSGTPQMDGEGSAGTATTYARGDHQHPSDTSRVSRSGDIMDGTLSVVSETAGTVVAAGSVRVNNGYSDTAYGAGAIVDPTNGKTRLLPANNGTLALQEGIAPAFSSSSTYAVGDYVTHEGLLYKCATAVSTAGAWNAANWTAVSAMAEMPAPGAPNHKVYAAIGGYRSQSAYTATTASGDFVLSDGAIVIMNCPIANTANPTLNVDGSGDKIVRGSRKYYGADDVPAGAMQTGGIYAFQCYKRDSSWYWILMGSFYAPLASPAFTGTPTAPTAPAGTNTTQIATTAFVQTEARYALTAKTPSVSGTAATVACEDRAINDFTVATGITSLTITPPAAVTGRARDFFCRVTLTDSSLPTVTLSGATIDIGSSEVAGMTQGVNLLMFTEIASGHWLASRRSAS